MSESRNVSYTAKTDKITVQDHGGIVVYNNGSVAMNVTLPAAMSPMFCQVSALGTGVVTFIAEGKASLNGTVGGSVAISQNTPYWLSVHYSPSGIAQWFLK